MWISMLSFAKWILVEYNILVVKMNDDMNMLVVAKRNPRYV